MEENGPIDRERRNVEDASADETGVEGLSEVFMELIYEFQAVTGLEDMRVSRSILERYDWDLLNAIAGHIPDPLGQEETRPLTNHNTIVQDESAITNNSFGNDGSAHSPSGFFGWVWKLVTAPVHLVFRYLWNLLGYGLRFLQQDPRRLATDPVQDVMQFINNYEAKFGTNHPVFYQGTYGQALNDAKRELRFLLVYLQSDHHSDTDNFSRNVLANENFIEFVRQNVLFWGCSVSTPEGYRTSQALRENTYPFLALIVLKNHRMTIVARLEGITNAEVILNRLRQSITDNEAFLVAERQERHERSMTQSLREQQDAAYEESLRVDREKERLKREAREKKEREEKERQRQIDEEIARKEYIEQQKSQIRDELQPEPDPKDKDVLRIVIKLPSGKRLERRFRKYDSLKHLYYFVFSHPDAPDSFEIATNFPKRTLCCKPTAEIPEPQTFEEFGLGPKELLFVYDLES